jgi:NADH dehydrogenase
VWALEDERTRNQVIDVGGPEQLSFRQITQLVMRATGVQRRLVVLRPPYLRALTILLEHMLPGLPVSVYWLDYLAANHTCALDSLPRTFNLMPARISQRLAYLQGRSWRVSLLQTLRGGYNPR